MKKPAFLYSIVWRCTICQHEQTRGYDSDGGAAAPCWMICKGQCRRPPSSELEYRVVEEPAARAFAIESGLYLGELDGKVPQTTTHLMVSAKYNRQEKKRREALLHKHVAITP